MKVIRSAFFPYQGHANACLDEPVHRVAYPLIAPTDGSGIGTPMDASRGAYGESLERSFFYRLTSGQSERSLASLDEEIRDSFVSCLLQNKIRRADGLESHNFQMSGVWSVYTGDFVFIPTVFISLAGQELVRDRRFLPFVDSTGCAAHNKIESAFQNSFLEFIERQSLIYSWYNQECRRPIAVEHERLSPQARRIFEALSSRGVVRFFDISCFENVTVSLALFSSEKGPVHFSVGMSASLKSLSAVEKSLIELWQSFVFVSENYDRPELQKGGQKLYHREFLNMNSSQTAYKYRFFESSANVQSVDAESHDFSKLLAEVKDISKNVFFFSRYGEIAGNDILFSKIVSPDFFVHKNIRQANNYDNAFVRKRFRSPCSVSNEPIPFP